jgi:hypothetical protein
MHDGECNSHLQPLWLSAFFGSFSYSLRSRYDTRTLRDPLVRLAFILFHIMARVAPRLSIRKAESALTSAAEKAYPSLVASSAPTRKKVASTAQKMDRRLEKRDLRE